MREERGTLDYLSSGRSKAGWPGLFFAADIIPNEVAPVFAFFEGRVFLLLTAGDFDLLALSGVSKRLTNPRPTHSGLSIPARNASFTSTGPRSPRT
ncbi:MAG TPA: hypothetical protein VND65_10845 [Candidatus Binatia bacterium]|nr:hypothetical protein [Candidatus Binatia bacterium]